MRASAFLFVLLVWLAGLQPARAQHPTADAGPHKILCLPANSVQIGGAPTASGGVAPYTYQWQPAAVLNNAQTANPVATITATTIFTLTVTGGNGETGRDTVSVAVYGYNVNAGKDTTILEGQTITLHGQANGATGTYWQPPSGNIYNQNTLNPDVFPSQTTVYTLAATFPNCPTLYDYITVIVIPSSELSFFNTFSPNSDGANDYFYIGNIEKYPDNVLEIYNRYGQKVFSKTGYQNDWNGKYLNNDLPAGTYYYILDTKDKVQGKKHGSVTIIR